MNYNGSSAGDFEIEVSGDGGNTTESGTLEAVVAAESSRFTYSQ